jgi:hypothetical protein
LQQRNVWGTFGDEGISLGTTSDFMAPNANQVAFMLERGNSASTNRIASALRSGDVEFGYANLGNEMSGRYLFGEISLNENMPYRWKGLEGLYRAATTTAHEGQHYLDDISGVARNPIYQEARALIREERFAESIGRPQDSLLYETRVKLGQDSVLAPRSEAWQYLKQRYLDAYSLDPAKF